ncbi:fungal hydrophobin [Guyanagaster necrorhizus]|uniref:Hydrophobin n=1 Tax=Guyanagaster necrorhizus TaxID=856835 RepID=A0A9P7VK24_9AGAR|nr:fungal hydrophobin [Guyanagaster necrorhizus MCA 3950]KAG7442149.1 fungal hydrophobin [Guyanagaster necrorhizus MCA 3950]
MFPRAFAAAVVMLATLASIAMAAPTTATYTGGQCNTGSMQCCNQAGPANKLPLDSTVAGILSIILPSLSVPVGISCTPISVIGAGGNSCTEQTVCCENNNFNGVIAIGCTPINLNL